MICDVLIATSPSGDGKEGDDGGKVGGHDERRVGGGGQHEYSYSRICLFFLWCASLDFIMIHVWSAMQMFTVLKNMPRRFPPEVRRVHHLHPQYVYIWYTNEHVISLGISGLCELSITAYNIHFGIAYQIHLKEKYDHVLTEFF